jgi:hypothetical protein
MKNKRVLDIVDYSGELTGIPTCFSFVEKGGTPVINKKGILNLTERCDVLAKKDYI